VCRFTLADFQEQLDISNPGSAIGYIETNGFPGFNEGDELVSLEDEIAEGVVVSVACYEW